jgi:hypothetical protein
VSVKVCVFGFRVCCVYVFIIAVTRDLIFATESKDLIIDSTSAPHSCSATRSRSGPAL